MGPTSTKNGDPFSVSFVSEMGKVVVSPLLADTCLYCVIMFSAALSRVTLGFLEKISSAVACARSYIYFFKWKLKSNVH